MCEGERYSRGSAHVGTGIRRRGAGALVQGRGGLWNAEYSHWVSGAAQMQHTMKEERAALLAAAEGTHAPPEGPYQSSCSRPREL